MSNERFSDSPAQTVNASHLRLVMPPMSLSYSESIKDILDSLCIDACLATDDQLSIWSPRRWLEALNCDIRRVHDLVDTLCDDLTAVSGTRFRRKSELDRAKVTAGLLDEHGWPMAGTYATMAERLRRFIGHFLAVLPFTVEGRQIDRAGTPGLYPVSSVLGGKGRDAFFQFQTEDGLDIETVTMRDTRLVPIDEWTDRIPESAVEALGRARGRMQLRWEVAVLDGGIDGQALVIIPGGHCCPLAIAVWRQTPDFAPVALAGVRSYSRQPSVRIALAALAAACLFATVPVAWSGGWRPLLGAVASLATIGLWAGVSWVRMGQTPSFLFPMLPRPAEVVEM